MTSEILVSTDTGDGLLSVRTNPLAEPILTHWSRVMHICVDKLTFIGLDNGLSPSRRQAIIWTSTGILLIGLLGTNFSEIVIEILTVSLKKMHLKVSFRNGGCFVLASMW